MQNHRHGSRIGRALVLCGLAGSASAARADVSAKIDGDGVLVSSPQVSEPVAVRYGWGDNPLIGLTNKAGLPASPFRTDAWK